MRYRTTVWHCVRLAWALIRHPDRKHLRIMQMLLNPLPDETDLYYVENSAVLDGVE